MAEKKPFLEVVLVTYSKVYPMAGWDPVSDQLDSDRIAMLRTRIIQITSFLGLPNELRDKKNLSIGNILKQICLNMIAFSDIPQHDSTSLKILKWMWNIFKAVFALPYHSISAVLNTIRNILKLFTEFMPSLLANILKNEAIGHHEVYKTSVHIEELKQIEANEESESKNNKPHNIFPESGEEGLQDQILKNDIDKKSSPHIKIFLLFLLYGFTEGLHYLVEGIHFLGKAITSPTKGIRSAWHSAHKFFGKKDSEGKIIGYTPAGYLVGTSLALASLGITLTVYILLFPFISAQIANTALGAFIAKIAAAHKDIFTIINNIVEPIFSSLGIPVSTNLALNGFSAILGGSAGVSVFMFPVIADFFDYLIRKISPMVIKKSFKENSLSYHHNVNERDSDISLDKVNNSLNSLSEISSESHNHIKDIPKKSSGEGKITITNPEGFVSTMKNIDIDYAQPGERKSKTICTSSLSLHSPKIPTKGPIITNTNSKIRLTLVAGKLHHTITINEDL